MRYLAALILLLPSLCLAQNKQLESAYRSLSQSAAAKNASWGVYVADVKTGKALLARNEDMRLMPASTLKLFVTAAALHELGPDYRFSTDITSGGNIAGDTLRGDLVITGAGDPSLGSTVIAGAPDYKTVAATWAEAIYRSGLRKVKGDIVADVSLFDGLSVPSSWPYEDLGNYYAAEASALSINDNQFKIWFKTPKKAGEPAPYLRTEPEQKRMTFTDFMRGGPVSEGDNGFVFRAPRQLAAELRGTIPARGGEFAIKASMPEPALFTAELLRSALEARGIKVSGKAVVSAEKIKRGVLLARTLSSPVKDIVYITNKRSYNFYAEMLLRALAVHAGKSGSEENGLAVEKNFLDRAGLDVNALKLHDACGLSKNNLVSARSMARLLAYMNGTKEAAEYKKSLPFPGDGDTTGHIRNFGKGTSVTGHIWLKSGSLYGVRSYAGYIRTKSGKTLVFAFIINGYGVSGDDIDALHAKLALACQKL